MPNPLFFTQYFFAPDGQRYCSENEVAKALNLDLGDSVTGGDSGGGGSGVSGDGVSGDGDVDDSHILNHVEVRNSLELAVILIGYVCADITGCYSYSTTVASMRWIGTLARICILAVP